MDEAAASEGEPARRAERGASRRGFVREVGIIVLGVLIALAIGEAADAGRRQARVAQTRERIDAELRRNLGVFEERALMAPCLATRVAALEALLKAARRTGEIPDIGPIGGSAVRPVTASAWELAVGSGVTLDMPVAEVTELAMAYNSMAPAVDDMFREWQAWGRLRALEGAPGRISDDLLAGMLEALSDVERGSRMNAAVAEQNAAAFRARGLRPDYHSVDTSGDEREVRRAVAGSPSCQPLMVNGRAWAPSAG